MRGPAYLIVAEQSAGASSFLAVTVEEWPYLNQEVLVASRSRQVCLTCHFFRHHAEPNCIPLLTCQLHPGLIAQGEHLASRCTGWTQYSVWQRGWAPEA